jgi:hypothetical protein
MARLRLPYLISGLCVIVIMSGAALRLLVVVSCSGPSPGKSGTDGTLSAFWESDHGGSHPPTLTVCSQ